MSLHSAESHCPIGAAWYVIGQVTPSQVLYCGRASYFVNSVHGQIGTAFLRSIPEIREIRIDHKARQTTSLTWAGRRAATCDPYGSR